MTIDYIGAGLFIIWLLLWVPDLVMDLRNNRKKGK